VLWYIGHECEQPFVSEVEKLGAKLGVKHRPTALHVRLSFFFRSPTYNPQPRARLEDALSHSLHTYSCNAIAASCSTYMPAYDIRNYNLLYLSGPPTPEISKRMKKNHTNKPCDELSEDPARCAWNMKEIGAKVPKYAGGTFGGFNSVHPRLEREACKCEKV